jgi:hypothetical protein
MSRPTQQPIITPGKLYGDPVKVLGKTHKTGADKQFLRFCPAAMKEPSDGLPKKNAGNTYKEPKRTSQISY